MRTSVSIYPLAYADLRINKLDNLRGPEKYISSTTLSNGYKLTCNSHPRPAHVSMISPANLSMFQMKT